MCLKLNICTIPCVFWCLALQSPSRMLLQQLHDAGMVDALPDDVQVCVCVCACVLVCVRHAQCLLLQQLHSADITTPCLILCSCVA